MCAARKIGVNRARRSRLLVGVFKQHPSFEPDSRLEAFPPSARSRKFAGGLIESSAIVFVFMFFCAISANDERICIIALNKEPVFYPSPGAGRGSPSGDVKRGEDK